MKRKSFQWLLLVALLLLLLFLCWIYVLSTTINNHISATAAVPTSDIRSIAGLHKNLYHHHRLSLTANASTATRLIPVITPIGGGLGGPTVNYHNPWGHDLRLSKEKVINNETLRAQRVLYIITPTYERHTQMIDLLRLGQTLQLALLEGIRLYWILIEDAKECSWSVRTFLQESGIPFAHLAIPTPPVNKRRMHHKGVDQRNAGLKVIEEQLQQHDAGAEEGVVYFADDDNVYSIQLFHELLYTTHVSVFAVGLVGSSAYERCHVDSTTGKVDALLTTWNAVARPYPIDMAGFAFATIHLRRWNMTMSASTNTAQQQPKSLQEERPKLRFRKYSKPGFLESDFIKQLVQSVEELEPLAGNCTRILVWHVKTAPRRDEDVGETSRT